MRKVCGFKLVGKEMYIAALEGTRATPVLVAKESITFPSNLNPGQFTDWAETQFDLILSREKPCQITYKLPTGLNKHQQIFSVYFGLAMLNFVAYRKGIPIRHVAPQSLRPRAFGLERLANIDNHIKVLLGPQGHPWNANIREAASVALLELR